MDFSITTEFSSSIKYGGAVEKNTSSNGKCFDVNNVGKVLDFYKEICSNFPDASFRLADESQLGKGDDPVFGFNGSDNQIGSNYGDPGRVSISIDVAVIKKAMQDEEFKNHFIGTLSNQIYNYSNIRKQLNEPNQPYGQTELRLDGDQIGIAHEFAPGPYATEESIKKNLSYIQVDTDKKSKELFDTFLKMTETKKIKRALQNSHPL